MDGNVLSLTACEKTTLMHNVLSEVRPLQINFLFPSSNTLHRHAAGGESRCTGNHI